MDNLYQLDYTGEKINEAIGKAFEVDDKIGKNDVYTKTQIDTQLADKANSADVYTKAKVDTELDKKANTSDVYTKAEADTELSKKADTDTVYTKTQTDNIIKTKMGTVYKVKGSLGFIGTPISVDDCEIGDVYNIFGDSTQATCWLFNNFDFTSTPKTVSVENGHLIGFNLLHLRSDTSENPPTITLRYNGINKTFNISGCQPRGNSNLIFTSTDIFEAFGITDYSSVKFMDLISIENNWIDVPNGSNVVYTDAGWDILSGTVDLSNYYTKAETDEELSKKTTMQEVQNLLGTELDKKADKENEYGGFAGGLNAEVHSGGAIGQNAATDTGGAAGVGAAACFGGAIGENASAENGGAIGIEATNKDGFSGGAFAKIADNVGDAIQLGEGTNEKNYTLKIYDYVVVDDDSDTPSPTDGSKYLKDVGKLPDLITKENDNVVVAINSLHEEVENKYYELLADKADKSSSIPHTTVSGYPMTVTDHLGGENVLDYMIYGNSIQNGTPATETPIDIQSVGDLVTDTASEYYGKYDIPLYVGGVLTTHIYLNAPLRKVGNSADYIDFKTQKVVRYIKEQTFNGSEAWNYRDSDNLLHVSVSGLASSSYCVSTHFLDENRKDSSTTPYLRPVTGVLRLYQQPSNILWSSAAEFKAFLTAQKTAGTPLTVDYVLSTPTEESISAASFLLPNGEIVSMAAGTDTAPSKIELEYYQDINKVIAAIKAAILSNGGNV